jgi:hypothetical protein
VIEKLGMRRQNHTHRIGLTKPPGSELRSTCVPATLRLFVAQPDGANIIELRAKGEPANQGRSTAVPK